MRWSKRVAEDGERKLRAAFILFVVSLSIMAFAQAPPPAPPPAPRYTVVLDAAHGGDDTGGHSGTWAEKNTTLALSTRLRSLLAARGINVVATREADSVIDQVRRDELANHANAQACISLHASLSGKGVHLFTSSLAPASPARFQPWSAAQAPFINRSLALAGIFNSALQHAGMTVTIGRTSLPVIDSMACPALAIEISPEAATASGSAITPLDSLNDADYQARVAEAIAAAIVEWRSQGSGTGMSQP
jgi:N-acetylmuramoyl-L-alanine amidase